MPFEFRAPEIVPDNEQAQVWANVRGYFTSALEAEDESPILDEESLSGLHEALDAIDEGDWSKAEQYLEQKISRLKEEDEMAEGDALMKKIGSTELIGEEIAKLEALRESLILEEN